MVYRRAGLPDMETLADIQKRQLVDEGIAPSIDIDHELKAYFNDALRDGSLVEWVA